MDTLIQGSIMAFREGLEAVLVIMILLKYLEKLKIRGLKNISGMD